VTRLDGKVAVVTGAAGGIGLALARCLAEEGARVVVADVDAAAVEQAASLLRESGAEAFAVTTDVTDARSLDALRADAVARWDAVDVVCNNAGVQGPPGDPLWELPLEEWERVMAVNFYGVLHGLRTFVPPMLAGGRDGWILNTASMTGLTAMALIPEYVVSKHAVVALSESLRLQLAARTNDVSVTVLCPGAVSTGMHERERLREFAAGIAGWSSTPSPVVGAHQSPELVARLAVDAMIARRFWVLPSANARDRVESRTSEILAACSPTNGTI
jgi:1-deoxy-11beta-hydroxypentalenate dehydrogenase